MGVQQDSLLGFSENESSIPSPSHKSLQSNGEAGLQRPHCVISASTREGLLESTQGNQERPHRGSLEAPFQRTQDTGLSCADKQEEGLPGKGKEQHLQRPRGLAEPGALVKLQVWRGRTEG